MTAARILAVDDERATCEALLFWELGGTVATATCFEQARHAAMRQLGMTPQRMQFAEAGTAREVALRLAKERPDLCSAYGTLAQAPPDAHEVSFSEKVNEELRAIDVLDPARVATATKRALARFPQLAPNKHYGTGGRE